MKKGFTLIELLAVIVILAIIALIATPIILGIINDARESAKKRSAELVYTGVEYAYTTSMYQISSATGNITIQNIHDNFNVENTTKGDVSGTSFTVTTSEGVDCIISQATNGYDVKCGTEEDDDKYLSKTVVTGTVASSGYTGTIYGFSEEEVLNGMHIETSQVWCAIHPELGNSCDADLIFPTATACENYFVEEGAPAEILSALSCVSGGTVLTGLEDYTTDLSDIESNVYLKHDVVNNIITASYVCLLNGDDEYCLKYGDSYRDNTSVQEGLFGLSNCSFDDSRNRYFCEDRDTLRIGYLVTYTNGILGSGNDYRGCTIDDIGVSSCGENGL